MTLGPENESPQRAVAVPTTFSPSTALASGGESENSLRDSWLTILKRKWLIGLCLLIGTSIGLLLTLTTPKLYVATGRIQVRPGASNQYKLDAAASLSSGSDTSTRLESEVAILESNTLLLRVASELNLQDDPLFFGARNNKDAGIPAQHRPLDDLRLQERVIQILAGDLNVKRVPKTEIIAISCTTLSPQLSARIVNTLINDYIQRSFQTRYASTQRVSDWLSGQLDDLKNAVESSQEKLVELSKKLGFLAYNDQSHNLIVTQLEGTTRAAGEAEVNRIIAEARYRTVANTDPNLLESNPALLSNGSGGGTAGLLVTLRATQAQLETQYANLTAVYGPNYPDVKQAKRAIEENRKAIEVEQQRVVNQAREAFEAAKTNEKMTRGVLEGQRNDAFKERDDIVQFALVQYEFESKRVLYQGLLQRLREAGIQAGLEASEIDVVDLAMIPLNPTGIRRSMRVALWMFFGFFGGVALAFLLDSLDTSLRTIGEIEAVAELPSLAIIPKARRIAPQPGDLAPSPVQRNLDVVAQPKSHFAEAFRALRTALLLSTVGRPPKIILVTSATPSEGKSTTASNLSCILAQKDASVLLIDSDLRRPAIHNRFGLSSKSGLSTVLTGTTTLADSIQPIVEVPNLYVLPSGPIPPFPTEMVSSEQMSRIITDAAKQFTYVVIDSPPILSITDGVILARQCDAVVLVVRHGRANKHVLRRTRDLILRSGGHIAGMVINAVDLSAPEYYGYYGYYNYSYYGTEDRPSGSSGEDDRGKKLSRRRKD